jgi:protein-disulfide isomerase
LAADQSGLVAVPDDLPSLGVVDAPVTVISVRSFHCDHCQTFQEQTFPALRQTFVETGRVRWRQLDADDSTPRQTIFEVARAAHAAGVYWELGDFLFSYAHRSPSAILSAIENSDLPGRGPMLAALHDGSARRAATANLIAARELKISALPTFIVRYTSSDGSPSEIRITDPAKLQPTLESLLETVN